VPDHPGIIHIPGLPFTTPNGTSLAFTLPSYLRPDDHRDLWFRRWTFPLASDQIVANPARKGRYESDTPRELAFHSLTSDIRSHTNHGMQSENFVIRSILVRPRE
jgi:hypothetical protein